MVTFESNGGVTQVQSRTQVRDLILKLDWQENQFCVLGTDGNRFYQADGNARDGIEIERKLLKQRKANRIGHAQNATELAKAFEEFFDELERLKPLTSGSSSRERLLAAAPVLSKKIPIALNVVFVVCVLTAIGVAFANRGSHNPRLVPLVFAIGMFGAIALMTSALVGGEFSLRSGPNITVRDNPIQFWLSILLGYVMAVGGFMLCLWKLM